MYRLVLLIVFLASVNLRAQIEFDKIIHDHGVIRENGDKVQADFIVKNTSSSNVELMTVQPTCGCTLGKFTKKIIPPNDSSIISLVYDPKDRPGQFFKPAEITFSQGGKTIRRTIAVKGFTLGEDTELGQKTETNYHIEIAPFTFNLDYADNWIIKDQSRYNELLNDFTFIIDQYNFVTIVLDVHYREKIDTNLVLMGLEKFKTKVYSDFKIRAYPSKTIGFKANLIIDLDLDKAYDARVEMYSKRFTNHKLESSIIRDTTSEKSIEESVDYSERLMHYIDLGEKQKIHKSPNYNQFINRCRRNAIQQHAIYLGAVIYNQTKAKSKFVDKQIRKVRKELVKQGIPDEIITCIQFDSVDVDTNSLRIGEFLPPYNDSLDIPSKIDTINIFQHSNSNDNLNVQKLPSYFQQIKGKITRVDTSNKFFISMMDNIIAQIKNGTPIQFVMESSASKAPANLADVGNVYVARLRAKESVEIVNTYLKSRGIKDKDIEWKEVIPLVSGPEYDLQKYLPQYYYYFQYLKIIPIYKNDYKDHFISPYKLNFSSNSTEILEHSSQFQHFLDHLTRRIMEKGYVKLIIESSTSRVPPGYEFGKNVHLAYHRAQQAKNMVYEGIKERGFNPSKVVFTEERFLEQGPDFDKQKDNGRDEKYMPFQYIKILPTENITEN